MVNQANMRQQIQSSRMIDGVINNLTLSDAKCSQFDLLVLAYVFFFVCLNILYRVVK